MGCSFITNTGLSTLENLRESWVLLLRYLCLICWSHGWYGSGWVSIWVDDGKYYDRFLVYGDQTPFTVRNNGDACCLPKPWMIEAFSFLNHKMAKCSGRLKLWTSFLNARWESSESMLSIQSSVSNLYFDPATCQHMRTFRSSESLLRFYLCYERLMFRASDVPICFSLAGFSIPEQVLITV